MIFHTHRYLRLARYALYMSTIFVLSGCLDQYRDHFYAQHASSQTVSGEYESITSGDTLWILPDKNIKTKLLHYIDNAKQRVWLQIYMLTDRNILQSMIDAHKRGVDVRVILEGNVYGLPYANMSVYKDIESAGIPVKYADGYQFTFTHSKFLLVDDTFFISTGNFTKSFFESNRDFIFSSSDRETLEFLSYVFVRDFLYQSIDPTKIPYHIVLSPVDSRNKIEHLISSAHKKIILYTQTLADDSIIQMLHEKQRDGVIVQVCTADNESNRKSSSGSALDWFLMKKPYLHGKILLVDDEKMFLGSQNLTKNSLENNREVGILLKRDSFVFPQVLMYFRKDCIF